MTEKSSRSAAEAPSDPPSVVWRNRLLDRMLEDAPFDGWTVLTLNSAAAAIGLTEGQRALAAPDGVTSILLAAADRADAQAREAIAAADISTMKIRDRIRFAVKTRIEVGAPHREALRRAAQAAAAPWRATLGPKILWNAADMIWSAIGDESTDAAWYTKRLSLSAVIGATLIAWLSDDDPDTAWRVLDRQIAGVMEFEKFKAGVRKTASSLPNPLGLFRLLPPNGPAGPRGRL